MKTSLSFSLQACIVCLLAPLAGAQEAPEESVKTEPLTVQGGDSHKFFSEDNSAFEVASFPTGRDKEQRLPLRVRLEVWEAPAIEVAKRLDELQGAESLAAMRKECLAGAGGVRLVHSPVTTADASTQMSTESISERIYPTEYEPPDLVCGPSPTLGAPQGPKSLPEWLEQLMTSATPTSYETRNTGTSLTALAQAVAVEEKSWDLAVAFEDVGFTGTQNFGHESLHVTMPVISCFRTGGLVRLKEGQWRLLSVMEPPRGIDGKPTDRRWVTLVRLDPEN